MAFNGKRKTSEIDEVSGDDTVCINFSIRAQIKFSNMACNGKRKGLRNRSSFW